MEEEGKTTEDGGGVIETWLRKHRQLYTGATRHPFILSIRDGTIHPSSFNRWLGQDYLFVRAFVPFMASVLLKAWKESIEGPDLDAILGGVAALNDEIKWFKNEASKRGVSLLSITPLPANVHYHMFLENLMSPEVEFTVAITALWAIEAVYQESFAHCLADGCKTPTELKGVCERWGNDDFGGFCCLLKDIANRHLRKAPDDVLTKAEEAVHRVIVNEVEFWNMSHGET